MSDRAMAHGRIGAAALLAATSLCLAAAGEARADTKDAEQVRILVHSTADVGAGSLRQALIQANAAAEGVTVRIEFNVPGCGGPCTFLPGSALPPVLHDNVTIDGYSQVGAREASGEIPALLRIELDGRNVTNNGLNILSSGNVVKGLSIHGFAWSGIAIGGPDARGNLVIGNHIGLDPAGDRAPGNGYSGVYLALGAYENTIGGPVAVHRNVIAGNGWEGVGIHGRDTHRNVVFGNYIGTDAGGEAARPNLLDGVRVYGGSDNNRIGLRLEVEPFSSHGNLIAGNGRDGVRIASEGSEGNQLWANLIGTTRRGTVELPNTGHGVHVLGGATGTRVAGGLADALCLVSGNESDGVRLDGADESVVQGCRVGTNASGMRSLANGGDGVHVAGAADVSVGGAGSGEGNLLSGNVGSGVVISGTETTDAIVAGNLIGLDVLGNGAVPNRGHGIFVRDGASGTVIGEQPIAPDVRQAARELDGGASPSLLFAPSGRNVISANGGTGIRIEGDGTDGTLVSANKIGTDADGARPLGNGEAGVHVIGGPRRTQVGQGGPGGGNLISANELGVVVYGEGTSETGISSNLIGVDAGGVTPMGNLRSGLLIQDGARDSRVQFGTIAHNGEHGVWIHGPSTTGHQLLRTSVHDNRGQGIHLTSNANRDMRPPVAEVWLPVPRRLEGRTCGGCSVEVFANSDDDGEGETPLARTTAGEGGAFQLTLPDFVGPYLTLAASDGARGTSGFSAPFLPTSIEPTATPTVRPTSSPRPTVSPSPSSTPSPSATTSPTATTMPTSMPEPSATTMPSATVMPSPTLRPSATTTAAASATSAPSSTATRAPTARPSHTPIPLPSPGPSATVAPTGTREPTPTAPSDVTPPPVLPWRILLPIGLRDAPVGADMEPATKGHFAEDADTRRGWSSKNARSPNR